MKLLRSIPFLLAAHSIGATETNQTLSRSCNEVINVVPTQVTLAYMNAVVDTYVGDNTDASNGLKFLLESTVKYNVRIRKACTSCEEANKIWEMTHRGKAGKVMDYCKEESFQYGRTMSGLVMEPIDPTTGELVEGKVATSLWTDITDSDPFNAATEAWPSQITSTLPRYTTGALVSASVGTVAIVPDVIGNGEDYQNTRSYAVRDVYAGSTIPLLLKTQYDLQKDTNCNTILDKRVAIAGYSEGGYAAVAVAAAIDQLDDGYEHTFTGIGGAPVKLSTEQMYSLVALENGEYDEWKHVIARLGNAYSTNPDMPNFGREPFVADEYLDDVVSWAEQGLNYTEIIASFPDPASDLLNPAVMQMVLESFGAGNSDPCHSEFQQSGTGKICEAAKENDLLETLESFDYSVIFCHSPNDEAVYYSNLPDIANNTNFMMIQDVPGLNGLVDPQSDHVTSGEECLYGFIYPFISSSDDDSIRQIAPIDEETCSRRGKAGKNRKLRRNGLRMMNM